MVSSTEVRDDPDSLRSDGSSSPGGDRNGSNATYMASRAGVSSIWCS